jgi:hypothetical protein
MEGCALAQHALRDHYTLHIRPDHHQHPIRQA